MDRALIQRWRSPAGRALTALLSRTAPTRRERLVALMRELERSNEVASGLDFRGMREDECLVFRDVDLRGASFEGAAPSVPMQLLGQVDLRGASFAGARIDRIRLSSGNGQRISLRGADFTGASLREARLGSAMSAEVVFRRSDLRRAELAGANLSGCDFEGADAREATFGGARFDERTRFEGARLTHGYLDAALAERAIASGGTIEGGPTARKQAIDELRGTRRVIEARAPSPARERILEALAHAEGSLDESGDWLAAARASTPPSCHRMLDEALEEHLDALPE